MKRTRSYCISAGICSALPEGKAVVHAIRLIFRTGAAAVCLAAILAGCSRSPRVTYYTLESGAPVESNAAATAGPVVVVGPVTIPEVVDRPQFVVRVGANRVDILESRRWAEPLRSELPRLIADNLGRMLGSSRVSSYVQHTGDDADFRVLVDFQRFETVPEEGVTVDAVWSLHRGVGGVPVTGRTQVREPVGIGGYDAVVAAYGRAVRAVSADLAQAIRNSNSR